MPHSPVLTGFLVLSPTPPYVSVAGLYLIIPPVTCLIGCFNDAATVQMQTIVQKSLEYFPDQLLQTILLTLWSCSFSGKKQSIASQVLFPNFFIQASLNNSLHGWKSTTMCRWLEMNVLFEAHPGEILHKNGKKHTIRKPEIKYKVLGTWASWAMPVWKETIV